MLRPERVAIKAASALTATMFASLVAAGCGLFPIVSPGRSAPPSSASPSSSVDTPSSSPSVTPSDATSDAPKEASTDRRARTMPPADACSVVTADDRARLKMTKATNEDDTFLTSCELSNTPGTSAPYHFRTLEVSYSIAPPAVEDAVAHAKAYFARRKAADFQQPNPFAEPPTVRGTLQQTGDSKAGRDFDQGYYVFYETAVAGAKEGNGLAVILKGSVVITITASGNDIPGQRVADSRPIGNGLAQRMVDTVADHVIQGVKTAT